jgi:hypothetical protein
MQDSRVGAIEFPIEGAAADRQRTGGSTLVAKGKPQESVCVQRLHVVAEPMPRTGIGQDARQSGQQARNDLTERRFVGSSPCRGFSAPEIGFGIERQVLTRFRHVETEVHQTGRAQPHVEATCERQHVLELPEQQGCQQRTADRKAADLPEPLLHAIDAAFLIGVSGGARH